MKGAWECEAGGIALLGVIFENYKHQELTLVS